MKAVLVCDSNAAPAARHTWSLNDKQITIGGRYSLDSAKSLVINNVNQKDGGKYTCKAINDRGTDTKSTTATVYGELFGCVTYSININNVWKLFSFKAILHTQFLFQLISQWLSLQIAPHTFVMTCC
jgi:hypothetical protein